MKKLKATLSLAGLAPLSLMVCTTMLAHNRRTTSQATGRFTQLAVPQLRSLSWYTTNPHFCYPHDYPAAVGKKPLISWSLTSIRVMSGWRSRKRSRASRPLDASPTMHMSGWLLMRVAIPSRNSGWSSTLKTRIPCLVVHCSCSLSAWRNIGPGLP